MDNQLEIQLGQYKNAFSVNADNYNKIAFSQKTAEITEYDIRNVLNVSGVFEEERQANAIYRIYGKIQYLSILNGLTNNYKIIPDLFLQEVINAKNVVDSYDFYLLKAGTGYTAATGDSAFSYIRYFDVIATPNDFQIYTIGYSNNVYNQQDYAFNFNSSFNVDEYFDEFGFPATELFLYPVYKIKLNGNGVTEATYSTVYDISGNTSIVPFINTPLNIGSRVYGDLLTYVASEFFQAEEKPQTYYITTPVLSGATTIQVRWKYNPFISARLRYFADELQTENISGTSYYAVASIPNYATDIGDGNYVWKDILQQGFVDPISGIGVDYPFINQKRYLFQYTILDVIPDLNDPITLAVFTQIKFPDPVPSGHTPISDLANIGKPCA